MWVTTQEGHLVNLDRVKRIVAEGKALKAILERDRSVTLDATDAKRHMGSLAASRRPSALARRTSICVEQDWLR